MTVLDEALIDRLWSKAFVGTPAVIPISVSIPCNHENSILDHHTLCCLDCGEYGVREAPVQRDTQAVTDYSYIPRDTAAREVYVKKCLEKILGAESLSRDKYLMIKSIARIEAPVLRAFTTRHGIRKYIRGRGDMGKLASQHIGILLTLAGAEPIKLTIQERNALFIDFEIRLSQEVNEKKTKPSSMLEHLIIRPIACIQG